MVMRLSSKQLMGVRFPPSLLLQVGPMVRLLILSEAIIGSSPIPVIFLFLVLFSLRSLVSLFGLLFHFFTAFTPSCGGLLEGFGGASPSLLEGKGDIRDLPCSFWGLLSYKTLSTLSLLGSSLFASLLRCSSFGGFRFALLRLLMSSLSFALSFVRSFALALPFIRGYFARFHLMSSLPFALSGTPMAMLLFFFLFHSCRGVALLSRGCSLLEGLLSSRSFWGVSLFSYFSTLCLHSFR